jgi:hypothetical protein
VRRDAEVGLQPAARLGQDIQGAGFEHLEYVALLLRLDRNAQHQDRQRRASHDDAGKLDAVHFRHVQISADDVGPDAWYQFECFKAVGSSADDLDLGRCREHSADNLDRNGRVVHQQDPNDAPHTVCGGLDHQISLSRQSSSIV